MHNLVEHAKVVCAMDRAEPETEDAAGTAATAEDTVREDLVVAADFQNRQGYFRKPQADEVGDCLEEGRADVKVETAVEEFETTVVAVVAASQIFPSHHVVGLSVEAVILFSLEPYCIRPTDYLSEVDWPEVAESVMADDVEAEEWDCAREWHLLVKPVCPIAASSLVRPDEVKATSDDLAGETKVIDVFEVEVMAINPGHTFPVKVTLIEITNADVDWRLLNGLARYRADVCCRLL